MSSEYKPEYKTGHRPEYVSEYAHEGQPSRKFLEEQEAARAYRKAKHERAYRMKR